MANSLDTPRPPALPIPPETYTRGAFDQSNNVTRLFFNRLTTTLIDLLGTGNGGKYLYAPRGVFDSTTDQTASSANTGYPVEFEVTSVSSGVAVGGGDDTRVTVDADGVYNFQVTLQLEQNNSSAATVWVWARVDGADQVYSGQKNTIAGSTNATAHWNLSLNLTASQYVEVYWATSDTQLNLHTETASAPHPGIPAAVVSVSFVSNT
jgi:hypothetical protein